MSVEITQEYLDDEDLSDVLADKYILEPDIDEELGIEWIPPDNTKCTWEQDTDGTWYTECSEVYMEDNATDIKHCPYCGKYIVINNEEYNEYNLE